MNVVKEIYSKNSHRPSVPYRRIREPISLSESLGKVKESGNTGIIAEYKRKSPSGFFNSKSNDIVQYFRSIASNERVAGFSVLTEPSRFEGSYDDISKVQEMGVPILDKDFISTRKMVDNAYNSGADAILLILDFLDEADVYQLSDYALNLGMESLIEFHKLNLVERVRPGKGRLFGYNRRNLVSLKMEPQEAELLSTLTGREFNIILESGITSEYVKKHDISFYAGMLIGASILEGDKVFETSS